MTLPSSSSRPPRDAPPSPTHVGGGRPGVGVRPTWEPWAAALLLLVTIGFGALVLKRSAYSERRRTDAGVFFRAGYAVRAGLDPYVVPDDNAWYFLYPPGVAAAFVPLADPPTAATPVFDGKPALDDAGVQRSIGTFIPYPVSIVLWYTFSVACAVLCIELLARALTRGSTDPNIRALTPASGGWWAVRLWPLFMILPDLLSTLSRGQINTVVLACICAGVYAMSRGQRFRGGLAIGAAACIKVIPGVLLFDLLLRRGTRAIFGSIAAPLAIMILVPVLVYGPTGAFDYSHEWLDRVILAGLHTSEERLQAGADFADTDNLSIQGSLHNLTNITTPRGQRPSEPEPWIKLTHVVLSLGMLGVSLFIGPVPWSRPKRVDTALQITLRVGMLCCVMVLASPMSHRHYFVMILPALAALVSINIASSPLAVPFGWGMILIPGYIVLQCLPRFSQQGLLRDVPIPAILTILVWAMCAIQLVKLARVAATPGAPASA